MNGNPVYTIPHIHHRNSVVQKPLPALQLQETTPIPNHLLSPKHNCKAVPAPPCKTSYHIPYMFLDNYYPEKKHPKRICPIHNNFRHLNTDQIQISNYSALIRIPLSAVRNYFPLPAAQLGGKLLRLFLLSRKYTLHFLRFQ